MKNIVESFIIDNISSIVVVLGVFFSYYIYLKTPLSSKRLRIKEPIEGLTKDFEYKILSKQESFSWSNFLIENDNGQRIYISSYKVEEL